MLQTQYTITKAQIIELAEAHIQHFKNLLEGRTSFSINRGECEEYLGTWLRVLEATIRDEVIDSAGETEINEAVMSGDYAHIVPINENITSIQLP